MAKGKEERPEAMEPHRGRARAMSPFQDMYEQMDWMLDQLQRSFFGRPLASPGRRGAEEREGQRLAHIDVEDNERELVLNVELPGLEPEQVQVECRGDTLVIRGERRDEQGGDRERYQSYSSFYRQLPLPPDVEVDRADASFKNGLLRLRFPRREQASGQVKRIPIGRGERAA